MNKRRLLSLLLSAAMMVSTIPMTMATSVAAANKIEIGDDVLDYAEISATGTVVDEDDGNQYLNVNNRTANNGFAIVADHTFKAGVVYYLGVDLRTSLGGSSSQRFTSSQKGMAIQYNEPITLKANGTNWAQLSSEYWIEFTESCKNGLVEWVPTSIIKDIEPFTINYTNSSNEFPNSSVGHVGTFVNKTDVSGGLNDDAYIGSTFSGITGEWKHGEFAYIPDADRTGLAIGFNRSGGSNYNVPIDVDNIEIWYYDDEGTKQTVYECDFEGYDTVDEIGTIYKSNGASINTGNSILNIFEEVDYNRYAANAGSVTYSDATLTPGTYVLSGSIRQAAHAANTLLTDASNSATATITSTAFALDKTLGYTTTWTDFSYEIEVAADTELDLAIDFGSTKAVDLKNIALVKTYEDTAVQVKFAPESKTAYAGEQISVNIVATAANAIELGSFNFEVTCDNDALTLASLAVSEEVEAAANTANVKNNRLGWYATADGISVDSEGTVIATVTYDVASEVTEDDIATLAFVDIDVATTDMSVFAPYSTECKITLKGIYDITVADTENGTITTEGTLTGIPGGTAIVVDGKTVTIGDVTLTAEPDEFYNFVEWTGIDGNTVTGDLTIGATFEAGSTGSEINVVDTTGATSTNANVSVVVDTIGGLLQFTVTPAEGYTYEISETNVELNKDGNNYQSAADLAGKAVITVTVRKVDTVTIKANADAGLDADVTYYIVEGKDGIYDDDYTTKIEALPTLTVDEPGTDDTVKNILPAEPYKNTTKAAILAGEVTGDIEIELAKAYKIFFKVKAGDEDILSLSFADAWVNEGETPAYPTVTVNNTNYSYQWDKDLAAVDGTTTYTVEAKAGSTNTILGYVDANEPTVTVAPTAATVSDFAGEQLKVTPGALAGYLVENVTATIGGNPIEFTNDGTTWTSVDVIEAQATVTITYREVIEITVKTGAEGAVVTGTKLYAKDNLVGLYSDEKCTVAVNALPAITYTTGTGMQWIPLDTAKPYVVGGANTSAAAILAAQYTADTEITTNGVKQWQVIFQIKEGDTNVTFEGATAPVSVWVADNTDVTAPTLVPADHYTAAWDKTVVTPVTEAATYTASSTADTYSFSATEGKVEAAGLNGEGKAVYGQDIILTFALSAGEVATVKIGTDIEVDITDAIVDNKYTIAGATVIGDVVVTVSQPVVTVSVPAGMSVNGTVGGDGVTVQVNAGDTITIVPDNDVMASAIYYGGNAVTPVDGVYSVVVTADGAITYDEYTYDFISDDEYMALKKDPNGVYKYQILVLGENVETNDTVYTITYADGTSEDLYYSSAYKAYVAIIDASYTNAQIAAMLSAVEGEAEEVNYNGDVNGDGTVTAGDAALVSDILHNVYADVEYDDIYRLNADVNGNKQVTSTDATMALQIVVGM